MNEPAYLGLWSRTEAILKTLHQESPQSAWYVAVSGGVDSMVLLHVIQRFCEKYHRVPACILHFHHHLREESDEEMQFIQSLSRKKDWPLQIGHADVQELYEGSSLENQARNARYSFFVHILAQEQKDAMHSPFLFTAHHRKDQAESVLMHFLHGAGMQGLEGMHLREGRRGYTLVRPFLAESKENLLHWAEHEDISYREDASNEDCRYLRNRIRHQLLPLLEDAYNPKIENAIEQMTSILQEESGFLEEQQKLWARRLQTEPNFFQAEIAAQLLRADRINMAIWGQMPSALQRRWIRHYLIEQGLPYSYAIITSIQALLSEDRRAEYILCGKIFERMRDWAWIYDVPSWSDSYRDATSYLRIKPNQIHHEPIAFSFSYGEYEATLLCYRLEGAEMQEKMQDPNLHFCVVEGDASLQFGPVDLSHIWTFQGGRKPVRRWIKEKKIPRAVWPHLPALTDGDQVVWIPTLGRSAWRRVNQQTSCLFIEWSGDVSSAIKVCGGSSIYRRTDSKEGL